MKLMKTTSMLTTLLMAATLALVGCGKKNESGKKANTSWSQLGTYPGTIGTGTNIPTQVSNGYAQVVFQYLPCMNGQQRIGVQFGVNMSVAANATYIGITSEGDIAILSSAGTANQAVFSAYICNRAELGQGQGSMRANPAVGRSGYPCKIDEISAASLYLPTVAGYTLTLNFRPIYYGVSSYPAFNTALSSVCGSY